MHTKSELLAALRAGQTLTADRWSPYAGEAVEYLPQVDEVNGHPDAYPWHVVGRPDYDRVRATHVKIT